MAKTVVGLFGSTREAQRVKEDLVSEGYSESDIRVVSNDSGSATTSSSDAGTSRDAGHDTGFGATISNFFRSLTGGSSDEEHYTEGVRRGGALVMVTVADERAAELTSVLESYGAQNVEDESAGTATGARGLQASSTAAGAGRTAQAQAGSAAIPVVEEELQVGKRQVQRGGVRVYSHVVETPVEETVRLREERVNVDRRPVNRPATEADFAGFKEGTIEMTETAEEAVVSKNARVVEEVVIGKDATERTETIRDNVRRTEVEVEQLGADRSGSRSGYTGDDAAYRNHFQSNYATTGAAYNDYAPAYQYGSELANDPQYRSGDWDTTEAAVKNNWSSRGRGTWDEVKGAVRHGWESVRNATTNRS